MYLKKAIPRCAKLENAHSNELEFGIIELSDGETLDFDTRDRETAFIILSGKADFQANGVGYGSVGSRRNVFESPKAECFYAPRDCKVQIHSRGM